ncbi:MAG: DUF1822 family protein [Nostochopsis sp.]
MNSRFDLTNDFVEFEDSLEIITLEYNKVEQALAMTQQFLNHSRQWQFNLQALALFAFEEWLQKREPRISINREISSVLLPRYANVIDVICNLQIGEFKVCLIPTICFTEEEVTVSRAVVDIPDLNAHFYVVIGIEEELEIAAILGFLRHDQLVNYQPELQPEFDWNYHIPLTWFNRETNELLLYLQCLAPTAIPLPAIPTHRQASLRRMQASLLNLLPQLRNYALWEVLTWEQGTVLLTTPDLLKWLYQFMDDNTASSTNHLSDLLHILTQQAVNVRRWVRNQVDDIVQMFDWQVLPAPSAIRSREQIATSAQELEVILADIQRHNELEIPEFAGRAYQDIVLENRLRLYAVTWPLVDADSEWSLLLVLRSMSSSQAASGFRLRVSDQTGILVEEELLCDRNYDYIFTQVEGSYEDKFLPTIILANGESQTLPPFEFSRDEES